MPKEGGEGYGEKRKAAEGAGVHGQKMGVWVVWRCADTKLLSSFLLLLFVLFILFPLLPFLSGLLSPLDLRACLSGVSSAVLPLPPPSPVVVVAAAAAGSGIPSSPSATASSAAAAAAPPPPEMAVENYHPSKEETVEVLAGSSSSVAVVKRAFNPVGSAAYLFIQMGAYRGGPNTFAVVGLASKPLHVFAKPTFLCEWLPHGGAAASAVAGHTILPDWGYGRVYTAVVVNCTFSAATGADGSGGRLIISASTGGGGDRSANATERIEALVEAPGDVNAAAPPWAAPPQHEYLYCGSPLYGNLSPQRVREWLAYHARLFGGHRRAHFVLYDAGGVHAGVMEVLRPWMEKGLVSLHDVREQERFDGYYHNQFLVVNDCLHRHRFAARWIFFFDLDEFLYIPPPATLSSLLAGLSGAAQFTIEQMPMSATLCLSSDAPKTSRYVTSSTAGAAAPPSPCRALCELTLWVQDVGDGEAGVQGREEGGEEGQEVRGEAERRHGHRRAHVAERGGGEPAPDGRRDQVLPLPRHHRRPPGALQGVRQRLEGHRRRQPLRPRRHPPCNGRRRQALRA